MRMLLINSVAGIGSTGRICTDLAKEYEEKGYEVKIAYGRMHVPSTLEKYTHRIGTDLETRIHALETRVLDNTAFGSRRATREFLKWADSFNPNILWLHNLHGYYIDIEGLFHWIKMRPQMQVRWTLHDCWAFTGHCAYFTFQGCEKWKTHCEHCPAKRSYPSSYVLDRSYQNYERKKELFTGVQQMKLIVPSNWLGNLVKESFLREYPVQVVYNTIDHNIFKPTPSDFREKYGLQEKKVILGVANVWSERKGYNDFLKLAEMLDDQYCIVLVGLSEKQIEQLPKKIIGVHRTDSPSELATVYTAADLFLNPSREETFGMTTLEAVSCGTEAIVYQGTACEEVVQEFGGIAVEPGVENLYRAITGKVYRANSSGGGTQVCKIICFRHTSNPVELAELYTAADYFLNPTYEDNFPTVNLEALACGTRVITYDTGGSKETLSAGAETRS